MPGPKQKNTVSSESKPASKKEIVRLALAGGIQETDQIIGFGKKKFGVEIGRAQASVYKSQIRSADKARPAASPGQLPKAKAAKSESASHTRPPKSEAKKQQPPSKRTKAADDLVDAISIMKPLVDRLGAGKVKAIADLLG